MSATRPGKLSAEVSTEASCERSDKLSTEVSCAWSDKLSTEVTCERSEEAAVGRAGKPWTRVVTNAMIRKIFDHILLTDHEGDYGIKEEHVVRRTTLIPDYEIRLPIPLPLLTCSHHLWRKTCCQSLHVPPACAHIGVAEGNVM